MESHRADVLGIYREDTVHLDSPSITPEGYIRVTAKIARSGIQEYPDGSGGVRKELRHPDDVFSASALSSLTMLPITNLHPGALLDSASVKSHQVGFSGENVRVNGKWIEIPLVVDDADTVKDVQAGRRSLSVGYTVDLLEEEGTYDGLPYTHRQTNIRGNHIAIVDRARAGSEARINLDGGFHMENKLVTVVLDGIEYQASPEVHRALNKASEQITELRKAAESHDASTDTLQAKLDEALDKVKALEGKLKEAEDPAGIDARVKERLDLLTRAEKVAQGMDFSSMSAREIMASAVSKRYPDLDLSKKSDAYVEARFDALAESVNIDALRNQRTKTRLPNANDADISESEKARADALQAVKNAYKRPVSKEE